MYCIVCCITNIYIFNEYKKKRYYRTIVSIVCWKERRIRRLGKCESSVSYKEKLPGSYNEYETIVYLKCESSVPYKEKSRKTSRIVWCILDNCIYWLPGGRKGGLLMILSHFVLYWGIFKWCILYMKYYTGYCMLHIISCIICQLYLMVAGREGWFLYWIL